ncbi:hypothetical protein K7S29_002843 [Listeria monocytogenes]|nr:hypothetical protein [Listeria monocytogenes]
MSEEWFEFESHWISQGESVTIVDQLNELSKTHDIIEVHYGTYSSSDWAISSGGVSSVLVRARKKEAE